MEITRDLAAKVLQVVDAGLSKGLGFQTPGQMCVEAAVCYAMGLPHGDEPSCVAPVLRSLKIALNDKPWSSPQARASGLRRLAIAQLGSAGCLDEREFIRHVADYTIRTTVPRAMRVAAGIIKNANYRAAMIAAAGKCESGGARESVHAAADAGYAAGYAADAASSSSSSYAAAAADAAYAASYAADAAAA